MAMNADRLRKLADFIEKYGDGRTPYKGKPWKFQMAKIANECGTAGCIAGAAILLFGSRKQLVQRYAGLIVSTAAPAELLGLKRDEAWDMFLPENYKSRPRFYTAKRAVRVLRHAADTGVIDWSV